MIQNSLFLPVLVTQLDSVHGSNLQVFLRSAAKIRQQFSGSIRVTLKFFSMFQFYSRNAQNRFRCESVVQKGFWETKLPAIFYN